LLKEKLYKKGRKDKEPEWDDSDTGGEKGTN